MSDLAFYLVGLTEWFFGGFWHWLGLYVFTMSMGAIWAWSRPGRGRT